MELPDEPEYIYRAFSQRSCGNKVAFALYKYFCKFLYKSVWFYFIFFLSIILTYEVPQWLSGSKSQPQGDA